MPLYSGPVTASGGLNVKDVDFLFFYYVYSMNCYIKRRLAGDDFFCENCSTFSSACYQDCNMPCTVLTTSNGFSHFICVIALLFIYFHFTEENGEVYIK